MKIQDKIIQFLIFTVSFCYGISTKRVNESEFLKENIITIASRKSGQIRFEDKPVKIREPDPDIETTNHSFKFDDGSFGHNNNNPGRITFQDDNRVENVDDPGQLNYQDGVKVENTGMKQKKRRRRRRPRYQGPVNGVGISPAAQQHFTGLAPVPVGYPYPGLPGSVQPYPGFGQQGNPTGQYYRPPRRPKPSFASEALSAVTGALSSIALYDDYQCVPRMLCEAAGGGALGSAGVLQSVAGLQPLLTLLSAYNGISSSPLFVFGRAVFLGMTAKGNTASCRYAYPQCPTDPEQLVNYLNNHNGGFFRFFSSPQQNPQSVDQFYHQLSLQGQYGQYPQNFGAPNPYLPQNPQSIDQFYQHLQGQQFQQNVYGQQPYNQGYGLQQSPGGIQNPQYYGLYNPQFHQYPLNNGFNPQFQNVGTPNLYPNKGYGYLDNYGKKYSYNNKYGLYNKRYKNNDKNKIQRRIQNRPNHEYANTDNENTASDQQFKFPDNYRERDNDGKNLKFPQEYYSQNPYPDQMNHRKIKSLSFPEGNNVQNDNYDYSKKITNEYANYPNLNVRDTALADYIKYYSYYHGNTVNINKYNDKNEGVQTVYIVRGNGDPNNPEIVKIRPGEKINL